MNHLMPDDLINPRLSTKTKFVAHELPLRLLRLKFLHLLPIELFPVEIHIWQPTAPLLIPPNILLVDVPGFIYYILYNHIELY